MMTPVHGGRESMPGRGPLAGHRSEDAVTLELRCRVMGRVSAVLVVASLFAGCGVFDEERELVQVFVVLLAVTAGLNLLLIALMLFYFLPFTRPLRKRRRRR
jgi:hypothetical protein